MSNANNNARNDVATFLLPQVKIVLFRLLFKDSINYTSVIEVETGKKGVTFPEEITI
jgi:hypothetical protein